MTISRRQMPRQMYGLGSLVKSVKKGVKGVVSGVKDFAKSDLGKAALLYAGTAGLGSLASGGGLGSLLKLGTYAPSTVFGNIPAIFSRKGLGEIGTAFGFDSLKVPAGEKPTFGQFAKVFGIGALSGVALQALEASGATEEDITDVDALRSYLRQGYQQLNPDAPPMQVDRFVEQNTVEYRANGGRIGYAEGMNDPKTLPKGLTMDTTTKNPIPENALPKEIEMISKIMMGPGRSGIGEPEDGTMKGYQFFKDKYLPKKVKELSENFGYSEDEIYKMINTRVREYMGNPGKPLMAEGGRIKYANGSEDYEDRFMKLVGELMEAGFSQQEAIEEARERLSKNMAMGGRIGYSSGSEDKFMKLVAELREAGFSQQEAIEEAKERLNMAMGGRIKYAMGDSAEQNAMQASGIMGLPLNQNPAGITELDLRETGGFIPPVGVKEKADDIPAMLSNNEFVFTADAVRGMGGGDVEKGAQRLYDQMKMLEEGGRVA